MNNTIQYIQHIHPEDTEKYIVASTLYPEWLVKLAELATTVSSAALICVFGFLWLIFSGFQSRLDRRLTRSFKAETLRTVITLVMGFFLQLDWADGVKTVVILRPLVLIYATFALGLLLQHYLELFETDLRTELKRLGARWKNRIVSVYNKIKKW